MKSKCCNYEVTVNYGEEGTNCWICGKCWKPCDICPQEPKKDGGVTEVRKSTDREHYPTPPHKPKPLTCEKHSRILIGKKFCIDCKEVGG